MSYQPAQPQPDPPPPGADTPLRNSEEIQGNILAAFNKDHQRFLLLRFEDPTAARAWLSELLPEIATTKQIEDWNEEFSRRRKEADNVDPPDLNALWLNLGLTPAGLTKLSANQDQMRTQLSAFPSFAATPQGQAADLGDSGESDPTKWKFGASGQADIDAVLTVAADDPLELERKLEQLTDLRNRHQVEEVFRQEGETLPPPLTGHEHFGFMDGISQPAVKQFHKPDPGSPQFREGKIGERLTPAGEFVLGYENASGTSVSDPAWVRDGSFQVLRRLQQDVGGWNALVQERAGQVGLEPEKLGAKLVGRWKSGAPTALSPDQDPGNVTNAFDYEDDPPGHKTPLFAHIRKTYPRTAQQRFQEDRHRIMRRGIPFGEPFNPGGGYGEGEDAERGLVFNMYCADIKEQFEFMQQQWANDAGFPPDQEPLPHGPDPVIGPDGQVSLRSPEARQPLDFRRFVHTRGAVYAFCPAKSVLAQLAASQL